MIPVLSTPSNTVPNCMEWEKKKACCYWVFFNVLVSEARADLGKGSKLEGTQHRVPHHQELSLPPILFFAQDISSSSSSSKSSIVFLSNRFIKHLFTLRLLVCKCMEKEGRGWTEIGIESGEGWQQCVTPVKKRVCNWKLTDKVT